MDLFYFCLLACSVHWHLKWLLRFWYSNFSRCFFSAFCLNCTRYGFSKCVIESINVMPCCTSGSAFTVDALSLSDIISACRLNATHNIRTQSKHKTPMHCNISNVLLFYNSFFFLFHVWAFCLLTLIPSVCANIFYFPSSADGGGGDAGKKLPLLHSAFAIYYREWIFVCSVL